MPGVARKDGQDSVDTVHNSVGSECKDRPTTIATDKGSSTVFANNVGVVRKGDAVQRHTFPGCSLHAPPLSEGSSTVFVENQGIGRIGDTYGCGAEITSGSSDVIAGG